MGWWSSWWSSAYQLFWCYQCTDWLLTHTHRTAKKSFQNLLINCWVLVHNFEHMLIHTHLCTRPFLRAAIKIRQSEPPCELILQMREMWMQGHLCHWANYGELTRNDGWDKLSRMEKSLSIDISRVSSFRFTDLPCFSLWFFDPIPLISNTSIYVPANE